MEHEKASGKKKGRKGSQYADYTDDDYAVGNYYSDSSTGFYKSRYVMTKVISS